MSISRSKKKIIGKLNLIRDISNHYKNCLECWYWEQRVRFTLKYRLVVYEMVNYLWKSWVRVGLNCLLWLGWGVPVISTINGNVVPCLMTSMHSSVAAARSPRARDRLAEPMTERRWWGKALRRRWI